MAADVAGLARTDPGVATGHSHIQALAERAARGDKAAFDELIALHATKVLNLAYRLLNDSTDAEDASQEAFVKAFRSLRRLRDRSQFTAWMLKITTNACRDFLRRRHRRDEVSLEEAWNYDDGNPIVESVEVRETQERVRELLATMPEKHRVVLHLRDIEGQTYEEMAVALSCTVSSVKNRLHRARAAFRQRAKPYIDEVMP